LASGSDQRVTFGLASGSVAKGTTVQGIGLGGKAGAIPYLLD